jgi:hypothetical protein
MRLFDLLKRIVKNPSRILIEVILRYAQITGSKYALLYGSYWLTFGKRPNFKNPQTFNEKMQWLKLHDHNPLYHKIVDKYEVKKYVADIIGDEYIIPTLGVWDRFDDIDFEKLPDKFVLKTTNGGGSNGVFICTDKRKFDKQKAKKQLEKSMKYDFYRYYGEWAYKDLTPRIIAEEYMADESGTELKDYKTFNFHGEPKLIQLDFNRFSGHKKNLYSIEWELLPFSFNFPAHPEFKFEKPICLDKMLELARVLSKDFTFVRVDFYVIREKLYFGEITFYPASGFGKFVPEEWDQKLGEMLQLPQ